MAAKRALVVGGTSGIGRGLAVKLARDGVDVTIAGRSEGRAQQIIETMQAARPDGSFSFMKVDAFSLSSLAEMCRTVSSTSPSLDMLVLTQGMATLQGFTPTDCGLDQKLTLHHFGRMACILGLRDVMLASKSAGGDPRVLSVLSAGVHSPYPKYREDPLLKNNYSIKNAADFAGFAQDVCLDAVARETPGVAFVHACPGFVATNWGTEMPTLVRWMVRGIQKFAKSEDDCAAILSDALLDRRYSGGGFHLMDQNGKSAPKTKLHSDEAVEFMWKATKDAIVPHLGLSSQ